MKLPGSILCAFIALSSIATADDPSTAFKKNIAPILKTVCTDCHGGQQPEAGLNLEATPTLDQLRGDYHHWFRVLEQIETGTMPPRGASPLPARDRATLLKWIRSDLTNLLVQQQRTHGRSRLRRLSRTEYANTVQDIFGIRPPVMRLMPSDGRVDGYDKVSGALPFSPAATEAHMKLAEQTITQVLALPRDKQTIRSWAERSSQSKGHLLELPDNWVVSFNSDANSGNLRPAKPDGSPGGRGRTGARKPGWHRLRMNVYGYQTDKPLPVGIYAGHTAAYPQILRLLKVIDVPPGKPTIVETDVYLRTSRDSDIGTEGLRLVPLGLGVPVPKNTLASVKGTGPGLAIQWLDIIELEETLPGQNLLFGELPEDWLDFFTKRKTLKSSKLPREDVVVVVRQAFAKIGTRLYRRDLTQAELNDVTNNVMTALDDNARISDAFSAEIAALMSSPDFLCVLPNPGELNSFQLAARLASFLWNSTPDEQLLAVARSGKLRDPKVLRAQTERLLNDPKSDRFVDDFLDQWLGLRAIDDTTPDADLYPEYDDELKISSILEPRATFRHMVDNNISVRDFVAPSWAMLNARLADVYGIPNVKGFGIREVKLPPNTPFGGLWTQPAATKVTANGTLTSPIKRGVWVSDRLLGITIPPPPASIKAVNPDTRGARTLRQQLARHTSEGSCKACHARFDPYGFALESFDVMGNFRKHYRTAGNTSDDKPVFVSDIVTPETPGHAVEIKANIKNAKQLWLVVDPVGDPASDHAAWIEPRLIGPRGELKLTDLKWKHTTQGWAETRVNLNSTGTPLTVNGTVVNGIGTHAVSAIGYDIPKGYETFVASGGLESSVAEKKRGRIRFEVYTRRPLISKAAKWVDGLPVDPAGTTPNGKRFTDIRQLRQLLAKNPKQLANGAVRHLLTYATGEPATAIDQPAIEAIVKSASNDQYGLRSLIHALIQSEVFRWK